MKTLKDKITDLLKDRSGLTDREITDLLLGKGMPHSQLIRHVDLCKQRG